MPRDEEAAESVWRYGLHFPPESCERAAAEASKDVGIDPLAIDASRTELTLHQPPGLGQTRQQRLRDRRAQAEAPRQRAHREGAMRAGEAQHEIPRGIADRLEQRVGKAGRQRRAEAVAVARRIFHRDVASLAREVDRDDSPRALELGDRRRGVVHRGSRLDLLARQVADAKQEIVNAVRRS